jgi:hypothetical protein
LVRLLQDAKIAKVLHELGLLIMCAVACVRWAGNAAHSAARSLSSLIPPPSDLVMFLS